MIAGNATLREKCPNTELFLVRIYSVSLRIQSKCGKIRTRKSSTHPSIVKIKKHFKIKTTFSFSPTSKDEIVAIIKDLQNGEKFL